MHCNGREMGRIKKTPNIQAKLAERKKKFENNFDVICNNAQNVIEQVYEHRNIDSTIVYLCVLYFQRNCLAVFEVLRFAVIIWYCPRFCPGPRTVRVE